MYQKSGSAPGVIYPSTNTIQFWNERYVDHMLNEGDKEV